MEGGGGKIRLVVGFQALMVISPTASWIRWCMQVYVNVDLSGLDYYYNYYYYYDDDNDDDDADDKSQLPTSSNFKLAIMTSRVMVRE